MYPAGHNVARGCGRASDPCNFLEAEPSKCVTFLTVFVRDLYGRGPVEVSMPAAAGMRMPGDLV